MPPPRAALLACARPLAGLALLAACAAPQTAVRPAPPGPAYREEAPPAAALLAEARGRVAEAQRLRDAEVSPAALSAVFFKPEDRDRYLAHYADARRSLERLLDLYPAAPEAPEAQLLLGVWCDAAHLAWFPEAVNQYHRTAERYPGTPQAAEALLRAAKIERYYREMGSIGRGRRAH